MKVNIKEVWLKSGMCQQQFSKVSGINRYSICRAANDATKEFIHLPDDRFYELFKRFPGIVEIPSDFQNYTRLSLLLNKSIYNIPAGELRKTIPASSIYTSCPYLYSFKDKFTITFPELYLPCVEKNGKLVLCNEIDILPFTETHIPEVPERFYVSDDIAPQKENERNNEAYVFNKYSVKNIKANIDCRMLSIKQFSSIINYNVTDMRKILKMKNCSLMMYSDFWDQLFVPYIIPVKRQLLGN